MFRFVALQDDNLSQCLTFLNDPFNLGLYFGDYLSEETAEAFSPIGCSSLAISGME